MRFLLENRFVISAALSAVTGAVGLHVWPFPAHSALMDLVRTAHPLLYALFHYTYATLLRLSTKSGPPVIPKFGPPAVDGRS